LAGRAPCTTRASAGLVYKDSSARRNLPRRRRKHGNLPAERSSGCSGAIGYYTKQDLPFFAEAAKRWTVCDRYFAAIISDSHAYEDAAEVRPPRSALTRSR